MSIPNGFYEVSSNWAGSAAFCDPSAPAFIRGRLVTQAEWNSANKAKIDGLFKKYPRWILYGGPISMRSIAEQWNYAMFFWAQQDNRVWIPDPIKPTPCIVPPQEIQWPVDKPINWGDIFRWKWVYETEPPVTLFKHNDNQWHTQQKGTT